MTRLVLDKGGIVQIGLFKKIVLLKKLFIKVE